LRLKYGFIRLFEGFKFLDFCFPAEVFNLFENQGGSGNKISKNQREILKQKNFLSRRCSQKESQMTADLFKKSAIDQRIKSAQISGRFF
jgi:hypothetical protein